MFDGIAFVNKLDGKYRVGCVQGYGLFDAIWRGLSISPAISRVEFRARDVMSMAIDE